MCEKCFASPLILRKHIESVHRDIKYKCNLCGSIFNSMSAMKRHKKNHLETKEHECIICQKDFSQKRTPFIRHNGSFFYFEDPFDRKTTDQIIEYMHSYIDRQDRIH